MCVVESTGAIVASLGWSVNLLGTVWGLSTFWVKMSGWAEFVVECESVDHTSIPLFYETGQCR